MVIISQKRESVTQSRQIQVFGLLGTSILILFIVIFLGKDFEALYLHYTHKNVSVLEDSVVVDDATRSAAQQQSEALAAQKQQKQEAAEKPADKQIDAGESMTLASEAVKAVAVKKPLESGVVQSTLQSDGMKKSEIKKSLTPVVVQKHVVATEGAEKEKRLSAKVETTEGANMVKADQQQQAERNTALQAAMTEMPAIEKDDKRAPQQQKRIDLRMFNRDIHALLQSTPFFQKSLRLTPENREVLDRVVQKIKTLPFAYQIVTEGHTASGLPVKRSQRMAKIAAVYLKKALPGVQITTVGYGARYPIIDESRDPANTRIEIIVRRRER